MKISVWPEERTEQLRQFWSQGLSASQIAARIGGSRSAILGKVHRLELTPRSFQPTGEKRKSKHERRQGRLLAQSGFSDGFIEKPTSEPLSQPVTPPAPDLSQAVSIFEHKDGQCRWIVVEAVPNIYALRMCGKQVVHGDYPYCECHDRLAHTFTRTLVKRKAA